MFVLEALNMMHPSDALSDGMDETLLLENYLFPVRTMFQKFLNYERPLPTYKN